MPDFTFIITPILQRTGIFADTQQILPEEQLGVNRSSAHETHKFPNQIKAEPQATHLRNPFVK